MTQASNPDASFLPFNVRDMVAALRLCRERLFGDLDLLLILGLTAEGKAQATDAVTIPKLATALNLNDQQVQTKTNQLLDKGYLLTSHPALQISPMGTALLAEIGGMLA